MPRLSPVLTVALFVCFLLVASFTADAQEPQRLAGVVLDEQGGAIPGAQVTIHDASGRHVLAVKTGNDGGFAASDLPSGQYVVAVEASLFERLQEQVVIAVGASQPSLRLVMKVAGHTESAVVTGTAAGTYRVESATAGSRVPVPLRDLPQSVQVVPRKVIDDQSALRASEMVQNVSGVYRGTVAFGDTFFIRGFSAGGGGEGGGVLRNGYADWSETNHDSSHLEQVEVLKGPASALYGRANPGGTINYVTKKPLATPFDLVVSLNGDSYGLFRPTVDMSSSTADGRFGLRVNAALERGDTFRDFGYADREFVSAVFMWRPSARTAVSFELEGGSDRRLFDRGIPYPGDGRDPLPASLFVGEPTDYIDRSDRLFGYSAEHALNPAWKVRHGLRVYLFELDDLRTQMLALNTTTGDLARDFRAFRRDRDHVTGQAELQGDIRLAGRRNQLLFGVDLDRFATDGSGSQGRQADTPSINVFNPVYGQFTTRLMTPSADTNDVLRSYAVYAQNLVDVAPQVKILIGARLDAISNISENHLISRVSEAQESVASPRVGAVWQPARVVALYTSHARAFVPLLGTTFSGELFEPERAEQTEIGAKTEWFQGRLSATTSVYRITKENVRVPDPANPGFSIQVGEVQSEGVELDVAGSPMSGLNLVANLALTDARFSRDTRANILGNRPPNVPKQGAALWASYELQTTRWRGLGGGVGAYHVGHRPGNDTATFYMPAFTRWDAGVWYNATQWSLSLKVNNLANTAYYESVTATAQAGIYPGAPRTALLSASYRVSKRR